eukprot:1670507-Prymnesium_polylepis.1
METLASDVETLARGFSQVKKAQDGSAKSLASLSSKVVTLADSFETHQSSSETVMQLAANSVEVSGKCMEKLEEIVTDARSSS